MMKVKDIYQVLDKIAPFDTAYDYDNVGLLVGDENQTVQGILLALDLTEAVVAQAIATKSNLIITHHPLIFKPLKKIVQQDFAGKLINSLIKHEISYIAMHTNLDRASNGVNDVLAEVIGLENVHTITEEERGSLVKLAVYIPQTHTEKLLALLEEQAISFSGKYAACSFTSSGLGRFKPLQTANPYLGVLNIMQEVIEDKVEFLVPKQKITELLMAIKAIHPYEEIAYDSYEMLTKERQLGILRTGTLNKALSVEQLANILKNKLQLTGVRASNLEKQVSCVAICGGSGADYIKTAIKAGADVLVTGDLKYHEAQEAQNMDLAVIALGHQESEQPVLKALASRLQQVLLETAITVAVAKETRIIEHL